MANENYIEDLKRRLAEHRTTKKNSSSHIEEAYETGCINILETAIQKYGENSFEEWLHKAEQSAKDLVDGNELEVHMLACGERDTVQEIKKEHEMEVVT